MQGLRWQQQVLPKSFGKSASQSLTAENGLARFMSATICAIPTAQESNHSGMGTLHQHGNATCVLYVALR